MEIIVSVGKYLVRTPLTEARIAAIDPLAGMVTLWHCGYEFGDDGLLHKKPKPDLEIVDELELLARRAGDARSALATGERAVLTTNRRSGQRRKTPTARCHAPAGAFQ